MSKESTKVSDVRASIVNTGSVTGDVRNIVTNSSTKETTPHVDSEEEIQNISLEEIGSQRQLLDAHRKTLTIYLVQQAKLGTMYTPPSIENGIREARANISLIKSILRKWRQPVDDYSLDEEKNL